MSSRDGSPGPGAFVTRTSDPDRGAAPGLGLQVALSVAILATFVLWWELNLASLHAAVREDGPIETGSALLFGLASLAFCALAVRSGGLRGRRWWAYLLTLGWAALMFVFMGEEISWGQRLLGYGTPGVVEELNWQGEMNVHNMEFVQFFAGGAHRLLSLLMLTLGALLPGLALTEAGRRWISRLALPVPPAGYGLLFLGAYAFGVFYTAPTAFDPWANDASEVREFLFAVAMFLFALHAALRPCAVFRRCADVGEPLEPTDLPPAA